ncbi:VOC family protein [Aureimonas endophytica]|nr:VOC family protein [Aureimonas endophytica]
MVDPDGTPVWFELVTPDQDQAQVFYEAVAGWSVATSPMPEHGGYRIASARDGDGVAGLMARRGEMPTGWTLYFAAEDVDALAEKVRALGGRVHAGPMDIPHVGRFAAASDPQGVSFSIMRIAGTGAATAFRQSMPGDLSSVGHGVWIELATPDPEAAFDFYGRLFGWTKAGAMPMGDMGDYAFIGMGADVRPGAVMSSATTGAPARWNWYVQVPDIDAALAAARDKGGDVLQGPDEIPGGAFSANVRDAQGFRIGLVGPRRQEDGR